MLRRIIGYLPAYRARIIHFLPMIRKIYNKGVPALPFYGIDDAGHDVVRVPYGIVVRIDILFFAFRPPRLCGDIVRRRKHAEFRRIPQRIRQMGAH